MKLSDKRQAKLQAQHKEYCNPSFCVDEKNGLDCFDCDGYTVHSRIRMKKGE